MQYYGIRIIFSDTGFHVIFHALYFCSRETSHVNFVFCLSILSIFILLLVSPCCQPRCNHFHYFYLMVSHLSEIWIFHCFTSFYVTFFSFFFLTIYFPHVSVNSLIILTFIFWEFFFLFHILQGQDYCCIIRITVVS